MNVKRSHLIAFLVFDFLICAGIVLIMLNKG